MDWRPWALLGLGGLAVRWAVGVGAPGAGGLAGGLAFRIGILYLVFGAATAWFRPATIRGAVRNAIGAVTVTALVGLVTLYYAEVVTAPPQADHEPLLELVLREVTFACLFSPIPAGYVGGVLLRQNRWGYCLWVLLCTIVGGFFAAVILVLGFGVFDQGGHTGLLGSLLFITSLAVGVAAVPLLVLMSRGPAQAPTPSQ